MSQELLTLSSKKDAPRGMALLAKGFRPFFVLAAVHAVLMVPLWLVALSGGYSPDGYLDPVHWHAHEMLFGFTTAVIAGFLLTAASNWTKRTTAVGGSLAALCVMWIGGRLAITLSGSLPDTVVAALDLAFLPALAIAIGRPILATGNRRNYGLVLLVLLMFGANVVVHLDTLAIVQGGRQLGHRLTLDIILLVILLIAGRIVPLFTRNATKASDIRSHPTLDRVTLVAMAMVCALDAFDYRLGSVVAGAVALLAAARTAHWGVRHTFSHPLLWVLHLGHAWIAVGLFLRALSVLVPAVSESAAIHALTVGALGTLTLGMMPRVSLGHTGRALRAPRLLTVAFVLMTVAALSRTGAGLFPGPHLTFALHLSGGFFAAAFALYLVTVAPVLFRARPDGKPG